VAKTVTFDDLATRLVGDKWCAHSGMWLRSSLPTPEALDDDSVTTKQTPAPVADASDPSSQSTTWPACGCPQVGLVDLMTTGTN
jgi:hypothetical protein